MTAIFENAIETPIQHYLIELMPSHLSMSHLDMQIQRNMQTVRKVNKENFHYGFRGKREQTY